MQTSIVCHLLVGLPGSGKSTIAAQWCKREPELVWVSTDRVRERLYGDAAIQGTWIEIETEIVGEMNRAIESGRSLIYDATNVRQAWRMGILQQVNGQIKGQNSRLDGTSPSSVLWMAWRVETPLTLCLQRNRERVRNVPQEVIEQFQVWMDSEAVQRSEGFVAVNAVPLIQGQVDWARMTDFIQLVRMQRS